MGMCVPVPLAAPHPHAIPVVQGLFVLVRGPEPFVNLEARARGGLQRQGLVPLVTKDLAMMPLAARTWVKTAFLQAGSLEGQARCSMARRRLMYRRGMKLGLLLSESRRHWVTRPGRWRESSKNCFTCW